MDLFDLKSMYQEFAICQEMGTSSVLENKVVSFPPMNI